MFCGGHALKFASIAHIVQKITSMTSVDILMVTFIPIDLPMNLTVACTINPGNAQTITWIFRSNQAKAAASKYARHQAMNASLL